MSSKSSGAWKVVVATIIIGFIMAMCFISPRAGAQQPRSVAAWPAGLDTMRYPTYHQVKEMSAIQIARLGLTPKVLDASVVVWNWTESRKRFLPDTLPAGVLVAVDSVGQLVYRVDCSNRLAPFPSGASVLPLGGRLPGDSAARLAGGDSANRLAEGAGRAGLGGLLSNAAGTIWGTLWGLLKFLGALLFLLLLSALFLAAMFGWIEFVRYAWRRRDILPNPPPPPPAPAPAAPTPTVVPPAPPVAPARSGRRHVADRRQSDRRHGERRHNSRRQEVAGE